MTYKKKLEDKNFRELMDNVKLVSYTKPLNTTLFDTDYSVDQRRFLSDYGDLIESKLLDLNNKKIRNGYMNKTLLYKGSKAYLIQKDDENIGVITYYPVNTFFEPHNKNQKQFNIKNIFIEIIAGDKNIKINNTPLYEIVMIKIEKKLRDINEYKYVRFQIPKDTIENYRKLGWKKVKKVSKKFKKNYKSSEDIIVIQKNIVKKYTVKELRKICKGKGIMGYSKLKKQELLDKCL